MSEAVAQELRAELARQKRSAKSLAESAGLNRSTLHKTLNAQRAIDVDDLFHLADLLGVSPGELFGRAEAVAREHLDDGMLPGEREGMPADFENVTRLDDHRFTPVDDERAVASEISEDDGSDEHYDD